MCRMTFIQNVQNLLRRFLFQYWYFGQPPWDTGVSPPELLEFIEHHKPGRAIDIGCGTGTNVITLANAGWHVTGIDFAPRAIKLARQKLEQAGVQAELLINDATKLNGIDGPFDFALDLGCFHGVGRGCHVGDVRDHARRLEAVADSVRHRQCRRSRSSARS